jgi:hypothetical protein
MGLDAIVYRNAANVLKTYGEEVIEIDHTTGEIFPKAGVKICIPTDMLIASRQRLGNVDEISFLRREIQKLFGDSTPLIIQKVLYSATHSGDILTNYDIKVLHQEVDVLRKTNNAQLWNFIHAMDLLIFASMAEQNPIVFV